MPRNIDVITKELDALLGNIGVWKELVRMQLREKVGPIRTVALYQELIDKAILVIDALIIEKKKLLSEETTAINIEPASESEPENTGDENMGGKGQKKRKYKIFKII